MDKHEVSKFNGFVAKVKVMLSWEANEETYIGSIQTSINNMVHIGHPVDESVRCGCGMMCIKCNDVQDIIPIDQKD